MVNKRKKNSRQRGSHTHGWGSMKKHRGAGNRGGVGRAGSGKRADSKKPSLWKNRLFGKCGFVSRGCHTVHVPVNILYLEQNIDKLLAAKKATKSDESVAVNLNDLGCNKLLGRGRVKQKFVITCDRASVKAVAAVESAGGKVIQKKERVANESERDTSQSS